MPIAACFRGTAAALMAALAALPSAACAKDAPLSSTCDTQIHTIAATSGAPAFPRIDANDDAIRHILDFCAAKGIERSKLAAHNELASGTRTYVLAEPGQQYLVYAAAGGSFSVNLAAGTYQACQFNPRTGDETDLGKIVTAGGAREFHMPDSKDWVVRLTAIPEPSMLILIAAGLGLIGVYRCLEISVGAVLRRYRARAGSPQPRDRFAHRA